MFYIVVCLCWAGSALAAPASTDVVPLEKQQPTVIPIVSQSEELEPNGTYKFSYETGNGIKREETSYDKKLPKAQGRSAATDSNEGGESDDSDEIHVQQGSYSYTAPDGTLISVRYIADENGFQPIGDHIPRAPGPVQNAGSSERGSKALKARDNAEAASAPTAAAKQAAKPESPPEATPEGKSTEGVSEAASTTAAAESEVTTKASDASGDSSTTEAVKSSEVPTEATSTEVSKSSESSTTELSAESASTGEPKESTTEAASTVAPKSTDASEASTTVTSDQPATATPAASTAESSVTEASTTVAAA